MDFMTACFCSLLSWSRLSRNSASSNRSSLLATFRVPSNIWVMIAALVEAFLIRLPVMRLVYWVLNSSTTSRLHSAPNNISSRFIDFTSSLSSSINILEKSSTISITLIFLSRCPEARFSQTPTIYSFRSIGSLLADSYKSVQMSNRESAGR